MTTEETPVLRVVKGDPTPDEVAALLAVVALAAQEAPGAPRRRATWSRPARLHRVAVAHAAGGWRSSALPR